MRLIDADVLLDSIFKSCDTTEATINNAPTIDAVPVVRGRWIYYANCTKDTVECSECEWERTTKQQKNNLYAYCPNCGCKMDSKQLYISFLRKRPRLL